MAFGALTIGDADGVLDSALKEIGIGCTLGVDRAAPAGCGGQYFASGT